LTLTPTELPTITPTIVHTDTPVILPLSSEGPWFVVATSKAIWAVNADGSGYPLLSHHLEVFSLSLKRLILSGQAARRSILSLTLV
jgi:hypothetical protein